MEGDDLSSLTHHERRRPPLGHAWFVLLILAACAPEFATIQHSVVPATADSGVAIDSPVDQPWPVLEIRNDGSIVFEGELLSGQGEELSRELRGRLAAIRTQQRALPEIDLEDEILNTPIVIVADAEASYSNVAPGRPLFAVAERSSRQSQSRLVRSRRLGNVARHGVPVGSRLGGQGRIARRILVEANDAAGGTRHGLRRPIRLCVFVRHHGNRTRPLGLDIPSRRAALVW